jgi:hypothetical protein
MEPCRKRNPEIVSQNRRKTKGSTSIHVVSRCIAIEACGSGGCRRGGRDLVRSIDGGREQSETHEEEEAAEFIRS